MSRGHCTHTVVQSLFVYVSVLRSSDLEDHYHIIRYLRPPLLLQSSSPTEYVFSSDVLSLLDDLSSRSSSPSTTAVWHAGHRAAVTSFGGAPVCQHEIRFDRDVTDLFLRDRARFGYAFHFTKLSKASSSVGLIFTFLGWRPEPASECPLYLDHSLNKSLKLLIRTNPLMVAPNQDKQHHKLVCSNGAACCCRAIHAQVVNREGRELVGTTHRVMLGVLGDQLVWHPRKGDDNHLVFLAEAPFVVRTGPMFPNEPEYLHPYREAAANGHIRLVPNAEQLARDFFIGHPAHPAPVAHQAPPPPPVAHPLSPPMGHDAQGAGQDELEDQDVNIPAFDEEGFAPRSPWLGGLSFPFLTDTYQSALSPPTLSNVHDGLRQLKAFTHTLLDYLSRVNQEEVTQDSVFAVNRILRECQGLAGTQSP